MVGGIEPLSHPGVKILPRFNFQFVDVRLVAECLKFLTDPIRFDAIALRIADENIRHGVPSLRRPCLKHSD